MAAGQRLFTVLIAMGVSLAVIATDETPQQQTARLKEIQQRIQSLDTDLQGDRDRAGDLSGKLRDIEKRLATIYRQLRKTEKRHQKVESERADLLAERAVLDDQLSVSTHALGGMLRAAYLAGRTPQMKLLLNQESPERLARQLGYLRYVNRHRLETVKRVRGQLDRLLALDKELAATEQRLARLVRERRTEGTRVKQDRDVRETLLEKLRARIADKGQRLVKLRHDRDRLAKLVQDLEVALADIPNEDADRHPIRSRRGRLAWPTMGKLVTRFGAERGEDLRWQGVMIGASSGDEVRAISHGRVAYADWLRGMGLLMIIDHGDGVMSLYGHNQALFRQVGEWVGEGDLISTVGDSGGLEQPTLYFEVRSRGRPVNPTRWCVRPKQGRVG